MKILLTGASGFLGKAIQTAWENSHEFITVGRHEKLNLICDLSKQIPTVPPIDMVVHAAGKAHIVPHSIAESDDFYHVNVTGTLNLMAGLENNTSLKKFVFISSVSVYGLTEGKGIKEEIPLLAADPYGKSKIAAEKIIADWCIENDIAYYILRLPLIAGKNAPGNLGAMVKGIKNGRYLSIGKAVAQKSMVLAEDIARFVVELKGPSGVYNLTDGYHPSFRELETKINRFFGKRSLYSVPFVIAKLLGFAGNLFGAGFPVNSNKVKKIISPLTFDDSKARDKLNWHSNSVLNGWEIE